MSDTLYAGDYFSITLPSYPPIIVGIKDYDLDRERYQKIYSYVRAKEYWVFRISDDPPVPGMRQGRLF
jgi:hypothetical protein